MKENRFSRRVAAVLFFLSAAWCVAEDAEKKVPTTPRPVVVEVFGYAAPAPNQPVSSIHREALEDALKNAVLQAHASLDVQVRVDGMRLNERQLRSRSTGSVEHSRVIDAGFMPNTDPPVYRVRMEVGVRPLPPSPAATPLSVPMDRQNPMVALSVQSKHGTLHEKSFRKALAASLQECGIRVVEAEKEPTALVANVRLTGPTNLVVSELRWELRRETLSGSAEPYKTDVLRGEWLIPGTQPFSSLELDKLGVMMAQDALRLWISPQPLSGHPADPAHEKPAGSAAVETKPAKLLLDVEAV